MCNLVRRGSGAGVEGDDAGAAEADVVLQRDPGVGDLARAGLAAQLPDEFGALGEAGGAERVALGEQAAGGVGDDSAAIGVVAVGDELFGGACGGEAEGFVGDEFVGGEAVVEFDDVEVGGADAGGFVDLARRRRSCRSRPL